MLSRFMGEIMQAPPRFSAIKIGGERAYDLAREGEAVEIAPRPIVIDRLELVASADRDHAEFVAECGKGTYVRALARDLGRALGTCGHVRMLRRVAVGPFGEAAAVDYDRVRRALSSGESSNEDLPLLPVAAGLAGLPTLTVSRADGGRLAQGQSVLLRGRDAPVMEGCAAVFSQGSLLALADIEQGELRPRRVFNLAR
jgi:tRNA pseudouridine55 synthase